MRTWLFTAFMAGCIHLLPAQVDVMVGENQKFIHFNEELGFLIIEFVQPGQTLYSLSRKYGLSVDRVLQFNPDLDPSLLSIGMPVNIPVNAGSIHSSPPPDGCQSIWLSYRVQPKETVYRISRIYLGRDPQEILKLNPVAAQGLTIGQVLHLGWYFTSPIQETVQGDSTSMMPKDFLKEESNKGYVVKEQKGLAVWKAGDTGANYFVLHPTAKVGSMMEITNPMLHRTISAKVAGNIPPGLYQSHVGIVVSPSTARALGVLDHQFFARWRYVE